MDAPARLRRLPTWLLSQAAIAGDRRVNEALGQEGVRKYHFRVLIALSEEGPLSQADLGRRLHIDRSDMAAVVGELERAGYVERASDSSDARAKLVRYSARGRRLMQDVAEVNAELWQELAESFGAAELERLAATIGALHRELVGPDAPLLLEPRTAKRPPRKTLRRRR